MTIESKFGINAGNGLFYSDPRLMPRWYEVSATFFKIYQGTTSELSTAANFFTELGKRGTAVDTNWTAASKKTLLTSSAPTLLHSIVGPAQAVGDTAVYEIVVDGVTYTFPTTPAATAGCRTVVGTLDPAGKYGTDLQVKPMGNTADVSGWGKISSSAYLVPSETFSNSGLPCLYARSSLTVSITVSANITATASQERQAGVSYRVVT